ncbi:PIN domain-containing protein, partial [Devosia sp.]|uniref:PIN domain-containing protein n=1 Tax=Devosia sp. TaxID=1871048 RepID=UPI0026188548
QGIGKLELTEEHQRARALESWIGAVVANFEDRILPLDLTVARAAGRLSARAFSIGKHPGVADILIAATAQVHELVLLTRNTRHFVPLDIAVADPTVKLPH